MRDFIQCFINGKVHRIKAEQAFMTVAEYLRYIKGLTGTKIVCAEGDCGACSILVSRYLNGKFTSYVSINSCISKMYSFDNCHLITVEGLGNAQSLNIVQKNFVDEHGAQCGYCTPGFICAMTNMAQDLKEKPEKLTKQKVKNYLTGNLCRCTGYDSIINAGMKLNIDEFESLKQKYPESEMILSFKSKSGEEVLIVSGCAEVYIPISLEQAIKYKDLNKDAKLISGTTDLGVLDNKGRLKLNKVLCLSSISEFYELKKQNDSIEVGSRVSLSRLGEFVKSDLAEFANMLNIFASPQIKNSGTLIGNVINASPIADTIPFLMVNNALIKLVSVEGVREVEINNFYKSGYKNIDLKENEIVQSIKINLNKSDYKLYKVSVRKDLDISAVTFAASYRVTNGQLSHFQLALGGVGPKVLRIPNIEKKLIQKQIDSILFKDLASQIKAEITPQSDHRGSVGYRYQLCENLLIRFGDELISETSNTPIKAQV